MIVTENIHDLRKVLFLVRIPCSIYRTGTDDLDKYYFSGLTPNFPGSTLIEGTSILLLCQEYAYVSGGKIWIGKILHEGRTYYIDTQFIEPDYATVMEIAFSSIGEEIKNSV